jgi:hypothetical protein
MSEALATAVETTRVGLVAVALSTDVELVVAAALTPYATPAMLSALSSAFVMDRFIYSLYVTVRTVVRRV